MRRRRRFFLIALLLSALFLPGCVTILAKRAQAVVVTAKPAGARVLVDGELRGATPLALRLEKRLPHVVRVEKDGYRPVEIRLNTRKNWVAIFFPNLIWASLGLPALANVDAQTGRDRLLGAAFITLGLVTPLAAMLIDAHSAKSNLIDPRHFTVTLEKDAGLREPVVILMDPAEFRNIIWISILDTGPAADKSGTR
jgi:hypothetical protein